MVKVKKSFLAVVMAAFAMLVSWFAVAPQPIEASAAARSYDSRCYCEITVETKANYWKPGSESITLQQTGQKYGFTRSYPKWDIVVEEVVQGKFRVPVERTSLKTKTKKIKLQPNRKYVICVSYSKCTSNSYGKESTWKISKTNKVTKYSVKCY